MKKITLLLAGMIMATGSFAQFNWGLKTGMNFSNLINSRYTSIKTGMHVGFFGEYRAAQWFALQPELLYSVQGGSDITKENLITSRQRIRLNYVILPVTAKFYVTRNLSIDAGPQVGYVIRAKRFDKDIDNTESRRAVNKYKREFNAGDYNVFDFSATAGLTYKLTRRIGVSARYSHGINDFLVNGDWKNSVIQTGFLIGF